MRPSIRPLLLFAALLPATAAAHRPGIAPDPGPHRLVEMNIIDRDHGDWLPLHGLPVHSRRGESWVVGTPGHRYAVRLANTSDRRVLVVLSVDGINAVTGETADPAQAGYVLEPWQSAEIAGWRKSLGDVAQFVFSSHRDSYASRTGRPRNVGVIGIAVFEEAEYRRPPYPLAGDTEIARESADAAGVASPEAARRADSAAPTSRQRLGTGHGRREWSPASRTHFVRASRHPAQVSKIRYDARERLVALGIIPRRGGYPDSGVPHAFPGGFVPDPPR